MDTNEAGPAGQRDTHGQILMAIKKTQPATVKNLSSAFGVSPNAIRRHLKELELDGLVVYGREQRGMGAPPFAYSLTPHGEALFPNRYQDALSELLSHFEERAGRGEINEIFAERFRTQAEQLKQEVGDRPGEERLQRLVQVASGGGGKG